MITLRDLTAWEDRLFRQLAGHRGPMEARDAEWTRTGLYADYAAIFSGYVDLAEAGLTPADRLEALKRAVFLVWYEGAEPAPLSGVTELPEGSVRRALSQLERLCIRKGFDRELQWMLPWYWRLADYALLRVPGLACLEEHLQRAPPDSDAWRHAPMMATDFEHRGRMGRYWGTLRRAG